MVWLEARESCLGMPGSFPYIGLCPGEPLHARWDAAILPWEPHEVHAHWGLEMLPLLPKLPCYCQGTALQADGSAARSCHVAWDKAPRGNGNATAASLPFSLQGKKGKAIACMLFAGCHGISIGKPQQEKTVLLVLLLLSCYRI